MAQLFGFVVGVVVMLGPFVLLVAFLNHRDRRETAHWVAALKSCAGPETRGRVTLRVRSRPLSRRSTVAVEFWAASREEIWELLTRLGRAVPPNVRIVMRGTVDDPCPARFTLEAMPAHPGYRAHRAPATAS
jgi:hypothetical protein